MIQPRVRSTTRRRLITVNHFDLRVFGDDLDVDAEGGAVCDELVLEAGIDPGAWPGSGGLSSPG